MRIARPPHLAAALALCAAAGLELAAAGPAVAANGLSVVTSGPEHRAPLASRPPHRHECTTPGGAKASLEGREIEMEETTSSTRWDDDAYSADIVIHVETADGGPAGPDVLANSAAAQMYSHNSWTLSCLGNGDLVATWMRHLAHGGELVARILGSDGTLKSEEIVLPESSWNLSVTSATSERLAILYGNREGGTTIVVLDVTDHTLSAPLVLPLNDSRMAAASDGKGLLGLLWHDANLGMQATIADLDSRVFGEPIPVRTFRGGYLRDLNVEPIGEKRFAVSWFSEAQGGRVARTIQPASSPPLPTTTTTTLPEPEVRFDEPIVLDAASESRWVHYGGRQQLGADESGRWLATWRAANRTGPRSFEYVDTHARSARNGNAWSFGTPIRDTDALSTSSDARVDGDGEGTWLQTWRIWTGSDGNYVVLGSRSLDDGSTWSTPYPLHAPSSRGEAYSGGPTFLEVHPVSPGRWLLAVGDTYHYYESESAEPDSMVRVLSSADGGASFEVAAEFPRRAGIAWNGGALAVSASLSLVVWSENDSLIASVSHDSGATWSQPARLHDAGVSHGTLGDTAGVSAAFDRDGNAVVVWRAAGLFGEDDDVLFVRSTDGATTWSEPAPIAGFVADDEARDEDPTIAVDSLGRWMVAWSSHYDGPAGQWGMDGDVLAATSTDGGATWSLPQPIAAAAFADDVLDTTACIDTTTAGRFGVLWSREDNRNDRSDVAILFASTDLLCGNGQIDSGETCDDGNDVEGDECDSDCAPPECGNGIVDPEEACDDGNEDDGDPCLPSCEAASCGDGHVLRGVEACDDANDDDTDACMSTCRSAQCGDRIVRAGVEECDDGNYDYFDACMPDCVAARCGDGRTQLGVEQCDDGDRDDDDWCSNQCELHFDCTTNGRFVAVATDAHRVLRFAVGATAACEFTSCDLNADGQSTAVDAAIVLKTAVGLSTITGCFGNELVVRLLDPVVVGAIQVHIPHAAGFDRVERRIDGRLECRSLLPSGGMAAFRDGEDGLTAGLLDIVGFAGPADLFACRIEGAGVRSDVLEVIVEDATNPDGQSIAITDIIAFGR